MGQAVSHATPYKGLIPYSEEDALFFFGREPEREIIIANLMASRLTLLYGASGVGKSSVLRAGVANHLRKLAHQNLTKHGEPEFAVVVFNSWRDDPVAGLAAAIQKSVAQTLKGQAQKRDSSSNGFSGVLKAEAHRVGGRLLIILDQFEEYFLYHAQEHGNGTFAFEFPQAVNDLALPVSFLISIREDALAKLDRFEGSISNLFNNYLRVEHLDRAAAREAIVRPIDQYNRLHAVDGQNVTIEPALVEAVLDQVKTGQVLLGEAGRGTVAGEDTRAQIETPFLQLVMTRLWNEEVSLGSQVLRLKTLETLGGAESIVRTHLDAVISGLTPSEQEVAANIFHYLVTPSGTKIAYGPSDLAAQSDLDRQEVVGVLEKLSYGDVRILRTVDPPSDHPDKPWYEIFHDVLAPAILEWRTRYNQAQELADAKRRAEEQKRRADEQARVARRLRLLAVALAVVTLLAFATSIYAFVKQKEARENKEQALVYLNQTNEAKVEAKNQTDLATIRKAEADEAQQTAQEQIEIAAANKADAEEAKADANAAIQAAETANASAGRAQQAASEANKQSDQRASETRVAYANLLAAQSRSALEETPQRSLLLAIEAMKSTEPTDPHVPGAEESLRLALSQSGGFPIPFPEKAVDRVAISPNNRWVIGTYSRGVELWQNTVEGPIAVRHRLEGAGNVIAFSADNRWLATSKVSETGSVEDVTPDKEAGRLYKLDSDGPSSNPLVLRSHKNYISAIAISPDSHWLVTAGDHHDVRLWDLTAADPSANPVVLPGGGNLDTVISISPDSHWLVTSSWDSHANRGETAATYLWNLKAANPGASPFELKGHTASVSNVAFSPDVRWLVTSSGEYDTHTSRMDKTPRVWDLTAPDPSAQPRLLIGHEGPIGAMAISRNSRLLVTGGGGDKLERHYDGTARVWDLGGKGQTAKHVLPGHNAPIIAIAITSGNHWVATFTQTGTGVHDGESTTYLWDLNAAKPDETKPVKLWDDFPKNVSGIRVSENNHWLVARNNNTAYVWDLTATDPFRNARILRGHEGMILSMAFSPDNHWIVTSGNDQMARVWSLIPDQPVASPILLPADSSHLAVTSADNRWLVTIGGEEPTGHSNEIARVWDLKATNPWAAPIILRGHKEPIFSVAISPDNHWVVTGSLDKIALLWDLTADDPSANPVILRGHLESIYDVAITPDNHWAVTASRDDTARLWDLTAADPSANPIILSGAAKGPQDTTPGISNLHISPDSRWLIGVRSDAPSRLWDLRSANPADSVITLGQIQEVIFTPMADGSLLTIVRYLACGTLETPAPRLAS